MSEPLYRVFISHVEKDGALALQLAVELEKAGYATWCYEHDSVPGSSYLVQTGRVIDSCDAFVLLISQHAFGSHQITKEVVRAHEANKHFFPVLCGVSHLDFQKREPEWRGALGAAASISLSASGAEGASRRIVRGLEVLGIRAAHAPNQSRIASLEERRAEILGPEQAAAAPRAVLESNVVNVKRRAGGLTGVLRSPKTYVGIAVVAALALALFSLPANRGVVSDEPGGSAGPIVVGVIELKPQRLQPEDHWMCLNTRDALNTILSKASKLTEEQLRVYAKEKIDFFVRNRGLAEIEVAEQLRITKMLSGSLSESDAVLTLEVQIVDISTGMLADSITLSRPKERLIDLQNEIGEQVLKALGVRLTSEGREMLFAQRTNDAQDSWKLLTDTLGALPEKEDEPHTRLPLSPLQWSANVAFAQTVSLQLEDRVSGETTDEVAIRRLLVRYQEALEAENLEDLIAIHLSVSSQQREAFERYFANAEGLSVRLSEIEVLVEGDEALATFTRSDVFTEANSRRQLQLEVRLSSLLTKSDGSWKIRGVKKP